MGEYKFGVTGQERKSLVDAISEILNTPVEYHGVPTFAYDVGGYHIARDGTVTGEYNLNLFVGLAARGFEPEPGKAFHFITPRGTLLIQELFGTSAEAEAAGYGMYFTHNDHDVYVKTDPDGASEHSKLFALVGATFAQDAPAEEVPEGTAPEVEAPPEADVGRLAVEVPLEGFTPQQIEKLNRMIESKAPLLKKTLGVDELPIRMRPDTIQFPWFPLESAENAADYAQFIHALCATAKEKKRVTAKPQISFENEKFAMRVWLISLGMVGKEYAQARKLLSRNLIGDSAFRYGKPETAVGEICADD